MGVVAQWMCARTGELAAVEAHPVLPIAQPIY